MEKHINGIKCTLCICEFCGKERWKKTAYLKAHPKTYCNLECHRLSRFSGKKLKCANPSCQKEIYRTISELKKSKSGDYFCSKTCATIVNNKRHKSREKHPNWKGGIEYRKKALSYYGPKCSSLECELIQKGILIPAKMIDVHHKDGDRNNNDIKNLKVLCVWCHAKKTRQHWANAHVV